MKLRKLVASVALTLSLGILLSLFSFTPGAFAQSATHTATIPVAHTISPAVKAQLNSLVQPNKVRSIALQYNQRINKLNIAMPRYTLKIKRLIIVSPRTTMPVAHKVMAMPCPTMPATHTVMAMPQKAMPVMQQATTTPGLSLSVTHPTINITINIYNPHYDFDIGNLNIASPLQLQLQR